MKRICYIFATLALCASASPSIAAQPQQCLSDRAYEWFDSSKAADTAELAVLQAALACEATPAEAYQAFVKAADAIKHEDRGEDL